MGLVQIKKGGEAVKAAKNIKGNKYEAIVIGVSAGGMDALCSILPLLPEDFPFAVIIVQHMHPDSTGYLATMLNDRCAVEVHEAEEKEEIEPGNVYIAPANYHLLVENDRTLSLSIGAPVNYARPSIDVLFDSAADTYREKLIGMVLTGANDDGSLGLKKIKELGGLAIVQDPLTAEIDSMPKAAIKRVDVDYIISLKEIGPFLANIKKIGV